jgi:hypothetical protein
MTIKSAWGNVRSVFIDFKARTGWIRLRTESQGTLTLKISNDTGGTFDAQTALVCSAVEYGNASTPATFPHLHATYEDSTNEIATVEFHWEHVFLWPPVNPNP